MLFAQVNLPLRNIHATESIPWWPLAPGWWFVLAAVVIAGLLARRWLRLRCERQARVSAFFSAEVSRGETVPSQIAQVSQLLRRAAREHHPSADKLQGDEWLTLLNQGMRDRPFRGELADLLLDGGFRRDVKTREFEHLLQVAERSCVAWVKEA